MKCNRCGDCCKENVCKAGIGVYKTSKTPCKGLIKRGNKYSCELMGIASNEQLLFLCMMLGVGIGCTNDFKESGYSK